MKLLDLLRATKTVGGLTAPSFIWIAAAILLMAPFAALIALWWKVHRESKIVIEATKQVRQLKSRTPPDPRRGLSITTFNQLSDIFTKSPTLLDSWYAF